MKVASFFKVLFLFLLSTGFLQAQDIVYTEDFNDDVGQGNDGGVENLSTVDWTLNTDACMIEPGDYVKVVETGDNRLEAVDPDGEAIWMSPIVDVSSYSDIDISVYTAETGPGTNADNKYIKLFYILDGGSEVSFFESSVDWGNSAATISNLNGNTLQLVARMKTTYASDKIYIDDILVKGTLETVLNDALTQVLSPVNQVSSQSVSSVINNEISSQSLLKFVLSESASSDNLDTKIASIKFKNKALTNPADLLTQFEGFLIYDGSDFIPTSSVNIGADEVTLRFSEGDYRLLDNSSQEYELRGFLKSSGILDGKYVVLELSASDIITYASGSAFDIGNSVVVNSSEHQISVLATQLNFDSIPTSSLTKNTNFSVSVNASDINGNIDIGANQDVDLVVHTGMGLLTGVLSKSLLNGEVVFVDLTYNIAENIRIQALGSGLETAISDPISIISSQSTDLILSNWTPSLLNVSSISNTTDYAVEVYRFTINDIGDDSESTFLNNFRLIPGDNNNTIWENTLAGLFIKVGGDILETSYVLNNSAIEISISNGELLREVSDGNSKIFSIFVYLKTELNDGEILQMNVENSHSAWQTNGSGLVPSFVGDLNGPEFNIDVIGTELGFINKPSKKLIPDTDFGMELKLVDKFGNQDLNSIQEARVSLASGTGNLTSNLGLNVSLINGKYAWTDLRYDKAENFTLLIEVADLDPILTDNISSLDANSSLLDAETPILKQVLNPLSIDIENSEAVLNFVIKDEASRDNTSTIVSSVKFYNSLIDFDLDWKTHIAGATIKTNGEIVANTTKIENEFILFSSVDIEIENGEQKEFELAIYFKKSLIPDHAKFQVEIRKDHEWKTSTTGSSLTDELLEVVKSPIHEINVNADRLSFISYPRGIKNLENFELKIAAVDKFQNIDIDQSSNISLSSKSGDLSQIGFVGNLEDGVLEVYDLSFSGGDKLELTVSGDLQSVTKEIFVQEKNVRFTDNFESEDLSLWGHADAWVTSSYKPINGSFSLKHNLTNAIGSSYITCPLNNIQIGSESIFWEFILHNSDWDPTSSNNFVFHLLMDSNNPELADNVYSVGINLSGSDDCLSLWVSEDENIERLIKSDFDWNKEETVAVKVEYNSQGEWILSYNRLGNNNHWLNAGIANSEVKTDIENWYSGLAFNFETASRAGELWFDDLKIETYNTAAYLKNYELYSDSLVLNFSEDLNILESSKLENFEFSLGDEPVQVKEIKSTNLNNQLVLMFENTLVTGNYTLKVSFVEDLKGGISNEELIQFDFYEEVQKYGLIINEIFVDESPVIGLPEYEFIELYNASDYPINIKDYKLKVGTTEKILSDFEIPLKAYLTLCSNAASELYREYGNSLGLSSFPILTNSGTNISLESSSGLLIDNVTYSLDWYGDNEKDDGGWSLERIDVSNFCSTQSNWSASVSEQGGTPGHENSIKGVYEDNIAPELISHLLLSNQELQVEFSESINEEAALLPSNYEIVGNTILSIIRESTTVLRLYFTSVFQDGEIQKLTINNLTDECGNFQEINVDFLWHDIHEYDLIINEIFADESPVIGLPEYEFIEIYNATDYPINIKDYKLKVGTTEKLLSDFEISSKAYLILCSNAATEFYREYGNSLGLSSFPSLTNSGINISLESSSGLLIDNVTYSLDWYGDDEKDDGGWSLERIDANNHSWQADNWRASIDVKGGTPGQINSIIDDNKDKIVPSLLSFDVDRPNSIILYFSETLKSPQVYLAENYSIDNGIGYPNSIVEIDDDRFALSLSFASDFESNIQYQFTLSDQLSDLAGNLFVKREFEFLLADQPKEGDLVINEVLFNPYPNGADYVELLNISDRIIDVKDLLLATRDDNYQIDQSYQISEESYLLEAGAYLLITTDTADVKVNYSNRDEMAFLEIGHMPSYNDDEGRVLILNKNNEQIDDFAYDEAMHFSQLTSDEGVSLERINPHKETNSRSNWISASQTSNFGTPGMQNSSYDIDELKVNEIGFKSKIFSPDNDGVDDRLVIYFNLEKSAYIANIRVYNSTGIEIRRLASNVTLSTVDELFWDGLLANKERAPIGIYVFYFELFHPDGEVKSYKKTCVLGGKFK